MWRAVGTLLILLVVSGCERGPDAASLEQTLQTRLDSNFADGLFSVHSFRRAGSAPFRDIEQDTTGIFVYYDAELQLQQDYSLTAWKGLNVGTLAFAIGATEAGIKGFRSRGNTRGDLLQVHGRFAFQPDGEQGWVLIDQAKEKQPEGAMARKSLPEGKSPDAVLADARKLLQSAPATVEDPRKALIVEELARAISQIDLRNARLDGKIVLATGPDGGTYRSFGRALHQYAQTLGVPLHSAGSRGSVENAVFLKRGAVDFALMQSDVAHQLYQGMTQEGLLPYPDLRAVASLWPEAVHLLTLRGSGIESLEDLRGRRVAIGERGSGSRVNARAIGSAAALQVGDFAELKEYNLANAIQALEAGDVDALFLTEAVPAPAVQALAARREDLKFVPLPGSLLQQLAADQFSYYPLEVAARSYPGQLKPFRTLGLAAALVTSASVSDATVAKLLDLLMTGSDALASDEYRAAFISRKTMRLGLALPLHPGAERYYDNYDRDYPRSDSSTDQ
jgi:TRAP transporter TAXI family solute receptor